MAHLHEVGEAVNDGEREVLKKLRDELPDGWNSVANFVITQGSRHYECDAVAISEGGWAYLIETKAWSGTIRGNDEDWILPPLVGKEPSYRKSPLPMVEQKAKILATVLRDASPQLKRVFVQPLVVLVSADAPELNGRCAEHTVLIGDMVPRLTTDPRPSGFRKQKLPARVGERVLDAVVGSAKPLRPSGQLGSWRTLEQVDAGPLWEIWSAVPSHAGDLARPMRLKKYLVDPLLTGDERRAQVNRARQDLEALQRLAGAAGAVPPVSAVEDVEGALVVVTEWPPGQSLASLIADDELDREEAEDVVEALTVAAATVHRAGIVHRNLNPAAAHLLKDGTVLLTDFDYARITAAKVGITQHIGDELDRSFRAPEVAADPAAATKASDVWSIASIAVALLCGEVSDPRAAAAKLEGRFKRVLGLALSDDPDSRPVDAEMLRDELFGEAAPELPLFEGFQPNDELDDRWVVQEVVEAGALARVYKVHDGMNDRLFAAKFIREQYSGQIDPADEYNLLFEVPDHAGLVKPEFALRLHSFRRSGKKYQTSRTFLLSRWVEGERLDRFITERLPPARCIEIVSEIADAVAHLHANRLLHRDLKPQNVIIESATNRPRVVDFNVSRDTDSADRTETGTPPYRPPDHKQAGWSFGSDVYALAAILAELLAGRPLRPSPQGFPSSEDAVPESLVPVLRRALAPKAEERYVTVGELLAALQEAKEHLVVVRVPDADEAPFPAAAAEELDRPNWNPYQRQLISLFSQSSASNAGTRGLDEFASWAYVDTLIDRQLVPDIASGAHRLVLITGNAGDGKTAFIQTLERRLGAGAAEINLHESGNGATIERAGHRFITNWDGSQDEGDRDNDDVLSEFFAPFAGESPEPAVSETRIIAINEGRLLDFVDAERGSFPWLSRRALAFFTEQEEPEESWFTIVNLNLRALTAETEPGSAANGIVDQLLAKFADERLWEPCKGCVAFEYCYARTNAEVLREPVLGGRISERLRQTVDLVRLRRRLHITMRDLRSALAFAVAGDKTCDSIVDSFEASDRDVLLGGQLYNAIFAASDKLSPPARSPAASQDRLLRNVGALDVAKTASPEDDARLWELGAGAIETRPEDTRRDRELLTDLKRSLPQGAEALNDRRARGDLRFLQASLRRKLFLEREDPDWIRMLPYERLGDFKRQLAACTPQDTAEMARAISRSEGLIKDEFMDQIGVRLASDTEARERSFVMHPVARFRLAPLDRSGMAHYVEYAPDTVRLEDRANDSIHLDVDLDLFETLTRILDGFTPSREELRGAWLNLRLFKERLASIPTESLLLSTRDQELFRLQRAADGESIAVERLG